MISVNEALGYWLDRVFAMYELRLDVEGRPPAPEHNAVLV